MDAETIRIHALSKKGVTESFPFNETTLVFKVMNKMFLLMALDETPVHINVKCNPDLAIELRERYPNVLPGYHMNKKNWNTVICDGSVSDKLLKEWMDHSYEEVVLTLPLKTQALLKEL